MKKLLPVIVVLMIGLAGGLGIGHIQVRKEQKVCQDKIKEADRKMAFMQKQVEDARTEAAASTASIQQQCKGDRDKLDILQNEKKTMGFQLEKLKEQMQKMETRARESEQAWAKTKKESDEAFARTKKELQDLERNSRNLELELKKTTSEKETLQAQFNAYMKKTTHDLDRCMSNNAELCIIAEDLIKKYRNKGLGAVLVEKEPLTEIRKIELEQFTQKYREEINKLKTEKKQ